MYNRLSYEQVGPQSVGSYGAILEHFVSTTQYLTGKRNPRVLDVGAGSGIYSEYLMQLGCEVVALDPNLESMSKTSATRVYQTFGEFSRGSEKFDLVHAKDLPSSNVEFILHAINILNSPGLIACVYVPLASNAMQMHIALHKHGFQSIAGPNKWEPGDDERDWYFNDRERNVLFAQN